jgi:hypothetical protein
MVRVATVLIFAMQTVCVFAQGPDASADQKAPSLAPRDEQAWQFPDAPSAVREFSSPSEDYGESPDQSQVNFTLEADVDQSRAGPPKSPAEEPYHWKGLILQSFAFDMLENATRIMTADGQDRYLLLNKPFWSDYWASVQQFNMRRWNDGDSFKVNYIGHPMQGAIAGYIEVQNDPRGRNTRMSRDPAYWHSVGRAFLWSTVFSTQFEVGPLGEAAIFNEGGFTYPIGCHKTDPACQHSTRYTNNTGWVDFIITPTVGTLWMIGEDTVDRYVSDPLVHRHPDSFGIKLVRASLNPSRSLANILRGHFPWWRDYEHPDVSESYFVSHFQRALDQEPNDHVDLHLQYTALGLSTNTSSCIQCRNTTTGAGVEVGYAVRKYLDLVADVGIQPGASSGSTPNIGGSLWTANFGVRSGYSGEHFALKVTLAPGFASYSKTQPPPSAENPNPPARRNFNFSAVAALSTDVRFTKHLAFRVKTEQMLVRYKSPIRDPDGIGTPPFLSFLSHDNYINSTNWGVSLGPVLRF